MGTNYQFGTIGYDTTFELNEFNEPRIRSEAETLKDALLFVLFSKPGNYPSLPQIGLDINNYLYSFYDEIDPSELKNKITEQCAMLGHYINAGMVQIKKTKYQNQPSLIIYLNASESFPAGYKSDHSNELSEYLIGITYDNLNNMMYNVTGKSST